MRLKTGRTPNRWRSARTSASLVAPAIACMVSWIRPPRRWNSPAPSRRLSERTASRANRRSEKPIAFNRRSPAASVGKPFASTSCSAATMSSICLRNQGS